MVAILGISTTHDSGAAVFEDGDIVAAASEERFNGTKHYGYLPFRSIQYCLETADITSSDLDAIAVPSDVLRANARLLLDGNYDTENVSSAPTPTFKRAVLLAGESAKRVLSANTSIPDYARKVEFSEDVPVHLVNHHESHAATAYYACGHDDALVVTLDGLGDRLSGTIWRGRDGRLEILEQFDRSGSLGWFYGIVTQALNWWIGNGEGKTMGLSSYADPAPEIETALRDILPEYDDGELVDPYDFSRPKSWTVHDTYHWKFDEAAYVEELIDVHTPEEVAASAQDLLEEQVLKLIEPWIQRTDSRHLATAGGIFLNVQLNQTIHRELDIDDYFIFPAAGDSGIPLGAALSSYKQLRPGFRPFRLDHPYYGPDITRELPEALEKSNLLFSQPEDIAEKCGKLLAEGAMIAWCRGRMEFGPRALGNRSILVDPTRDDSKERVNYRVKFRDSWRPFAPSILEEAIDEYFVEARYDPFMITTSDVRDEKRDEIPAVIHVDGTTRPQVVRREVNEQYWRLIKEFKKHTGTPVLLNTSYNLSGEPIVASPQDAIQTFYASGLDALAIGSYLLTKEPKPV